MRKNVGQKIIKSLSELQEKAQPLYVICNDEKDGSVLPFADAVSYCEHACMAVLLIGEGFALIKEETEKGTPKMLWLKAEQDF